jgi:hypothetical protein
LKISSDVLHTFNFTTAGNYPIDLVYFQAYGQAQVELSASPGSFGSFGATGSNFQLINSTAAGALLLASTPEPATAAILGVGAAMMLKRRRRSA